MGFVADNPTPTPQRRGRFVPDGEPESSNPFVREGQSELSNIGDASDMAITSLLNIPHNAWQGLKDLGSRLAGIKDIVAGTNDYGPIQKTPGPAQLSPETKADLQPGPIAQAAGRGIKAVDTAIGNVSPTAQDVIHQTGSVLGDVGDVAAAVAPVQAGIEGVGSAMTRSAATAPVAAGDIEGALHAVGYRNLPRQGGGTTLQHIGADVAGEPPVAGAQTLNNQAVTTALGKHEAGVPPTSDLDYAALAKARMTGPGKVYDATRAALPDSLVQDEQLQGALGGIGDTASQLPRSPDVEGLKQHMLNQPNMTKDELFSNIAQAREKASRYYASDEPDAHAIGDAYQGVADAYEDFVGRQLGNDPAALQAWQDARTKFAKNYAVQSAVKGKDVNAAKLAALQQRDPTRLTGGLQLIAEQQNRYPLSTGFGPSTFKPGGIGASGTPQGILARHVTGPAVGAGVGSLIGGPVGGVVGGASGLLASEAFQSMIRRVLGGNPAASAEQAVGAMNGPTLADFLAGAKEPEPPFDLKAPPGRAFTPNQPQLATGSPSRSFFGTGADAVPPAGPMGAAPAGGGPGGQIPLFDLLSHGVESEPAAGLTASAPQAPAAPGGIPFTPNLEHASGGLSLSDLLESAAPENNSDLAAVQSARIPDKTKGAPRVLPKEEPTPGSGTLELPERPGLEDHELSLMDDLLGGQRRDMRLSPEQRALESERVHALRAREEGVEPEFEPEPVPRNAAEREGTAAKRRKQDLMDDLSDHPDVMSQGVPEGTMTRTSPFQNNASGESAASLEAINRPRRNLGSLSPDGTVEPVLKDVTQADARATQGRPIIDLDTHEIIDRAGVPLGHIKGMIERWKMMRDQKFSHPPLSSEFE